jgi:hypothetical protein
MTRYRIAIVAVMSVAVALFVESAQAGVVITIQQVGSNVDVTGSGSLNLADLTSFGTFTQAPDIIPFDAEAIVGGIPSVSVTGYAGASFSGPTSFGGGIEANPISGSGSVFGIQGSSSDLVVFSGYVSGTSLGTSTDTYSGSLSSLGLTVGTYTWTWGTGNAADSLTVNILSPASVPEPSSVVLAAVGAVTLCAYRWCRHRRHQRRQAAA